MPREEITVTFNLNLALSLGGGLDLHHHHHHTPHSSQPGTTDILNSLQDLKGTFMTELQNAIAQLKADDAQLEGEIDEVLGKLAQVPGEIATAIQQALADAGVDDSTSRAAISEIDTNVRAAIDRVTAVLNPTPPVDGGDDTLGGGSGSDTLADGGGTDTTVSGTGSDTITPSDGAVSDPESEGATTADNQSHVEADPGQPASGGATPPASDAV